MESREPYPCIKLSRGKTDSVHVCFVLFIGESKLFLDADQALPQFFLELSDMFSSMCGTLRKLKATDGVCAWERSAWILLRLCYNDAHDLVFVVEAHWVSSSRSCENFGLPIA